MFVRIGVKNWLMDIKNDGVFFWFFVCYDWLILCELSCKSSWFEIVVWVCFFGLLIIINNFEIMKWKNCVVSVMVIILDEKKKKVVYENFGEFFIVMIKFIDFSLF